MIVRRPLFQERYLFFSQLAFVAALGHAWNRMGAAPKRILATTLGSFLGLGLAQDLGARPAVMSSSAEAARFLARSASPRDLIVAHTPRDLMVLRYYMRHEAVAPPEIKCPGSKAVGHLSQVTAIAVDDIVGDDEIWADHSRGVWRVRLDATRRWRPDPSPAAWKPVFSRWFEGPGSERWSVFLFASPVARAQDGPSASR
jgi:hypothetical protein